MFKKLLECLLNKRKSGRELLGLSEYESFTILISFICSGIRGVLLHFNSPRKMNVYGTNVKISSRKNFKIGKRCIIGDRVKFNCIGIKGISLGDSVSIGDYSKLIVTSDYTNLGSHITIGDGVGIGEFSRIGGSGGVFIGKNTIIGQYLSCHPENHVFSNLKVPIKHQGTERDEIVIGEDCWLGAKVTILAGSNIGRHCIVAAGAVVNGNFPDFSVIGGVPARIIKVLK